jgi:hypothetical protein
LLWRERQIDLPPPGMQRKSLGISVAVLSQKAGQLVSRLVHPVRGGGGKPSTLMTSLFDSTSILVVSPLRQFHRRNTTLRVASSM